MLKKNDKHQNELANIWNALADSVLEMTGEEIEEEILEDENDMAAVRQILLNSVKDCRQKNLRDARERYEKDFFFPGNKIRLTRIAGRKTQSYSSDVRKYGSPESSAGYSPIQRF